MKIFKSIVAAILVMIPVTLTGQSFMTEQGLVEFTSSVPLHSFTGTSDHLTGLIDLDENLVDFFIDLETLDTGNGRRDRDMYRTLNVEEYPFAEFTGKLENTFNADSEEKQTVTVSGEFTVNGVTNSLSVDGTLQKTENGIELQTSWILNITDYDIEPPGILFYRVDEEIEIEIDTILDRTEDEKM